TAVPPALALPTQWPDGNAQRLWAAAAATEAQALQDGVQEGGRQQVYLSLDDTEVGRIDRLEEQLWGVDKDGAVEPKLLSLEVMDIAIRRMAAGVGGRKNRGCSVLCCTASQGWAISCLDSLLVSFTAADRRRWSEATVVLIPMCPALVAVYPKAKVVMTFDTTHPVHAGLSAKAMLNLNLFLKDAFELEEWEWKTGECRQQKDAWSSGTRVLVHMEYLARRGLKQVLDTMHDGIHNNTLLHRVLPCACRGHAVQHKVPYNASRMLARHRWLHHTLETDREWSSMIDIAKEWPNSAPQDMSNPTAVCDYACTFNMACGNILWRASPQHSCSCMHGRSRFGCNVRLKDHHGPPTSARCTINHHLLWTSRINLVRHTMVAHSTNKCGMCWMLLAEAIIAAMRERINQLESQDKMKEARIEGLMTALLQSQQAKLFSDDGTSKASEQQQPAQPPAHVPLLQ
ncbi:hypothetical protein HaLaN_23780, partial [Haematococcus lacustris]